MNPNIGQISALSKCSNIEQLEFRPDFFQMINIKEIKGMHDYVKQTAASPPQSSARSLLQTILANRTSALAASGRIVGIAT